MRIYPIGVGVKKLSTDVVVGIDFVGLSNFFFSDALPLVFVYKKSLTKF